MIIEEIKIKVLRIVSNIDDKSNVITEIFYDLTVTNDETNKTMKKPCIHIPDYINGEFIDYQSITEENVINWIKSDIKYITTLNRIVDNLSDNNKTIINVVDGNFPWQ